MSIVSNQPQIINLITTGKAASDEMFAIYLDDVAVLTVLADGSVQIGGSNIVVQTGIADMVTYPGGGGILWADDQAAYDLIDPKIARTFYHVTTT